MSSELVKAAELAIEHAKKLGADQVEASLHEGTGVSITARQQELETVEKNNDKQLAVSVFVDHKTGSASSADLSEQGVKNSVEAALSIAKHTGADKCLGLADQELMASDKIDLDLYHPWQNDVSSLAELALECEAAALQFDKRISNSEGASVHSYQGQAVYANSHGFLSENAGTQHSISCSVIAATEAGMQRDYWYESNRNPDQLTSAKQIGLKAAQRTVARLDAKKIKSQQVPVMFDPAMAKSLVGHLIGAIKGGAIYKKASFMLDKVDSQVMPDFITIKERPHLTGASSSAWHDGEGVATPAESAIIRDGVLQRYVLGSYTSRKLGLKSTANAGGVRNLMISDTGQSFEQLLEQMGTGLLVTELIGSGINMVTGDYSRGAAGFWVENGKIQYPVEEITIAGNLNSMFNDIVAVGNDIDQRGNLASGSILLEKMTVAGS